MFQPLTVKVIYWQKCNIVFIRVETQKVFSFHQNHLYHKMLQNVPLIHPHFLHAHVTTINLNRQIKRYFSIHRTKGSEWLIRQSEKASAIHWDRRKCTTYLNCNKKLKLKKSIQVIFLTRFDAEASANERPLGMMSMWSCSLLTRP